MKKLFILAAAALMFTACSKDSEVVPSQEKNDNTAIGFQVLNKNMSRSTSAMESVGHYNFGVWAYKNTDAAHPIMANYLVGYFGSNVGYKKLTGTTNEGLTYDTTSIVSDWGYEGLGTEQYNHATNDNGLGEKFYTTDDTKYMSNNTYQYLRYWDLAANHVKFYAYAPYIKGANTVEFDNANHKMTFPVGSIVDGYDDASLYEYMYAAKLVPTTSFKQAVQLNFKRMNAKVNIAFYEVVDGYSVTIENLKGSEHPFISANPAQQGTPNNIYSNGLYKNDGSTIVFGETDLEDVTVTRNITGAEVYASGEYLKFKLPKVHEAIATSQDEALKANSAGGKKDQSYSQTTYYAIPKDNGTGLTFRLSFTLTSETGETIKVNNAAVFVPKDNCNWKANKAYTYVFKITKKATGTTESGSTITPSDPTIPGDALYPIVFDNCMVEDWEDVTPTDHDIN